MNTADKLLTVAAAIFRTRNKTYGSAYKRHGSLMKALFPEGVWLETPDSFNRFGVLNMIIGKLARYDWGHPGRNADTLMDLSVYSAMLAELEDPQNRSPE